MVCRRGFLDLDITRVAEDNCATVSLNIKVDETYAYVVTDSGLSVRLAQPTHPKLGLATDLVIL